MKLGMVLLAATAMLAAGARAQSTPSIALDTREGLFAMAAAINACGYNVDLATSDPLRMAVRRDVAAAVAASPAAAKAQTGVCAFYRDHQEGDLGHPGAQYISLALSLGAPPDFAPLMKERDLPPDATYVLGFLPLLKEFYAAAGLHSIWQKHQGDYNLLIETYHDPVSKLLASTDVYLRLPVMYLGRRFAVLVEPLLAPGQVNARNYADDYYVVTAPEHGALPLGQIRHSYLHYVLDPMALKRPQAMKRLEPLLRSVQDAPMDESYKHDVPLLVTESLIRAIEARTLPKASEQQREQSVRASEAEGFVLTGYFFTALAAFEKGPEGMRDAYPDLLYNIDVDHERKRASRIAFAHQASPEVVKAAAGRPSHLLEQAEQRLSAGDIAEAQKLAQQALDQNVDDPARALFLLARAATLSRDMPGARSYFERTLAVAREPRLIAWSHIYLGRIDDLQANREAALTHYRAALAAGDDAPATRAAAERGLQQAYAPPTPAPHSAGQPNQDQQHE